MRQGWSYQAPVRILTLIYYCLASVIFVVFHPSVHYGRLVLGEMPLFLLLLIIRALCNLVIIEHWLHTVLLELVVEICLKDRALAQFHQIATVISHIKWLHRLIQLVFRVGRACCEVHRRLKHISIHFLCILLPIFLWFLLLYFECFLISL